MSLAQFERDNWDYSPTETFSTYSREISSDPVTPLASGFSRPQILSIPLRAKRLLISDTAQPWSEKVQTRLQELIRLQRGWDGYHGVPVSFENAVFTMRVLEAICGSEFPAPQIVPGAQGDLQIEWHTLKGDLELHIKRPNDVHAWRSLISLPDQDEELDLTNDFLTIAQWVKDVVEFSIVTETAAL